MKSYVTLLITFLISITSFSQTGINYKALVKDNLGNVVANQSITIQFIILEDATNVYQETHIPTTDANGIAIVNIGEGAVDSGVFADIDWGADDHYLNVWINTGSGLTNMGTTQFMAVPYALNVTGLEALDEGNGIGWRLKGAIPANYGPIGSGAIDLSSSSLESNTRGSTGNNSIALGFPATASGYSSFAFAGTATGDKSVTFHGGATGNSSFSFDASASGTESFAVNNGIASGFRSFAKGFGSIASGEQSTVIGFRLLASGDNSFVIGEYNIDIPTAIFTVGNGNYVTPTNYNRTNAFEVYKDGIIKAPTLTNALINTAGAKALITKEYIDANYLKAGGNIVTNNVGIGRLTPSSLFEVYHQDGVPTSGNRTNAFSIRNVLGPSWQFYTSAGGGLLLYSNGEYRGSFNGTSGAYVQTSDRRLKKDITPLDNGTLKKVLQLNPVSYLMKDQTDTNINLGLISQEVQELFPSITHYSKEQDILTLSYTELIPILIKALQEQQEIIDGQNSKLQAQASENTSQNKTIASLLQRMNALEAVNNK